jgi:hypothetical protein
MMPLGQPPQDEQQLDELIRPSVPGDDPARQPMRKLFDPGDDPKGWDRASLRLNTHPLHPVKRLTQADFVLPKASTTLRLLGDSVAFGCALAGLAYFPLMLISMLIRSDISNWIWGTLATTAAGGAALVLISSLLLERHAEPY